MLCACVYTTISSYKTNYMRTHIWGFARAENLMLWWDTRISVCTLFIRRLKYTLIYCQSPSKSVTFNMHTSEMGPHRANKAKKNLTTYITHESQTPNSAIFLSGKTKKQMGAPRGEWWTTLTTPYIIVVTLPNTTSTDTSAWTKFRLLWGK